jgi:hypothetical protein
MPDEVTYTLPPLLILTRGSPDDLVSRPGTLAASADVGGAQCWTFSGDFDIYQCVDGKWERLERTTTPAQPAG